VADRSPVDAVTIGQGADRHPFLPVIDTDTLEQLHSRQLLLPRSGDLRQSVER